jgi:hypothetical protein
MLARHEPAQDATNMALNLISYAYNALCTRKCPDHPLQERNEEGRVLPPMRGPGKHAFKH